MKFPTEKIPRRGAVNSSFGATTIASADRVSNEKKNLNRQSSLVAGVTESIAGSPSSPIEGLKIGRVSR
jgi:hypothetical protein